MNANTRKWIYNVAVAIFVILGFYGYLSDAEIANWLFLLSMILAGVSPTLARKNLTPDPPKSRGVSSRERWDE